MRVRELTVGLLMVACLTGCGKVGISGKFNHALGNWAQVNLPEGCIVKQVAGEEGQGVIVLCEDGRVFH
jgi:hypothetical protein